MMAKVLLVGAVLFATTEIVVQGFVPVSASTSSSSAAGKSCCSSGSSCKPKSNTRPAFGLLEATPLFVDETTDSTRSSVQDYYGKTLETSDDLKTNACCAGEAPPKYIQDAINNVHPTVRAKYYGCGLCLPQYDMEDAVVLDLGSGAGRDVYIASQLVGQGGKVMGVDMTKEQLDTAREYLDYHQEKFGYSQGNVEFIEGYLENLDDLEQLEDNSVDIIISNCVINLCTDKEAVLKSCYRILKPGGEMYFSDVYSNRRVPESLRQDPVLWGECLSGALYWNDFENLARKVGFTDPRLVEDAPITINNRTVQTSISEAGHDALDFFSATYRLWKLPQEMGYAKGGLEPHCEDYGQAVVYKGTIPRYPSGWLLDKGHYFEQGKIKTVCGNTFNMLKHTRLAKHFEFIGNFDHHYGIFEGCGDAMPYDTSSATGTKGDATKGSCC